MGYAELLLTLEQLPEEKQAEVLDFAKFLAQRAASEGSKPDTLATSSLARWIQTPVGIANFSPLSRDEANAR
jgi:hypothetical protein